MTRTLGISGIAGATLLLAACSGGPDPDSFGARVSAEGGQVAALGKQWTQGDETIAEGRALIEKGEENIDDGEDLISKGRKQVRRGEDAVRKGERMKREAEAAYQAQGRPSLAAGS